MSNHAKGVKAEAIALKKLEEAGFKCLAKRFKTKAGEVDLIVSMEKLLVFCEVKLRKTLDEAAFSVTPRAQQRIRLAAEIWLSENEELSGYDCRFDCLFILPNGIHWLEDAF